MDSSLIRKAVQGSSRNIKAGNVNGYQVLKEDFYVTCKKVNLRLDDIALAVYLRGKSCRFGNPFRLNNSTICKELNTTERILRRIRKRLQDKSLIRFNQGDGKIYTEYTMLDIVMVPKYPKFNKALNN